MPQNNEVDTDLLRAETRPEHEATESLLPLTSPNLTRDLYGDILVCMHGVVGSWESWAAAHAPASLTETVQDRRRTPLLEADLELLGKRPSEISHAHALEAALAPIYGSCGNPSFKPAFLGAMYVMEGSTLGGQYVARHVEESLGFEPGRGNAYFRGYGQQTGARWKAFKHLLEDLPDESAPQVIAAAKAMFGFFGDSVRWCPAAAQLRLPVDQAAKP